jgi:hypothetical protein
LQLCCQGIENACHDVGDIISFSETHDVENIISFSETHDVENIISFSETHDVENIISFAFSKTHGYVKVSFVNTCIFDVKIDKANAEVVS